MALDGKPLVKMFADDLYELITKYDKSGLTNSEAVGTLELQKIDLALAAKEEQRPF